MSSKIVAIVDAQEAFIDLQVKQTLRAWGASKVERVDSLSMVGQDSLFGENTSASRFDVDSHDQAKSLAKALKEIEDLDYRCRHGLIITSSLARNLTRGLENAVRAVGGTVVLAKQNAKDKTDPAQVMLDDLSVSRDVKKYLLDYAGTNYSLIVPIVMSLSRLSTDAQRKLTIDAVDYRLPKPKGAMLPWLVDDEVFKGNATKAVENYRRVRLDTHFLVVISLLKRKVAMTWRQREILDTKGNMPVAEVAKILGETNNYPFQLSYKVAKRVSREKLHRATQIVYNLEKNVKGGSAIDSDVLIEIALVELSRLFR